ncbi:MAG: hypothetical protein ABIU07_01210, partial [Ramlibacter sp.]
MNSVSPLEGATAAISPMDFSSAASALTVDESANPAIAALLIMGLVATALIGAPAQFVRPETIKAAAASSFVFASLALWAWRLEKASVVRWNVLLLAPFCLAMFALLSAAWSPPTTTFTASGRWLVMGVIIFLGLNAFGRDSFSAIARAIHWCAVLLSLLALAEFWFGLSWFPTEAPPGANFGNRNFFAEFIAIALPFSTWMLVRQGDGNRAAFSGVGFGVILVGLMSTGTRSALISAILSISVVLLLFAACVMHAPAMRVRRPVLLAAFIPAVLVAAALGSLPTSNVVIAQEARGMTPVERTF